MKGSVLTDLPRLARSCPRGPVLTLLVAAIILSAGVPAGAQKMPSVGPGRGRGVGNLAYDLSLKDLDGRSHTLREYRGKRVVHVVFWATWCFPCVQEIPTLKQIYAKYHERGLEILGVAPNMDQTAEGVAALAQELKINYPILWDAQGTAMRTYKISYIPQNFLIGKDGVIRYAGTTLPTGYEQLIEKLLQEGGGAAATSGR